jgi:ribosomal protein L37AE/L43A
MHDKKMKCNVCENDKLNDVEINTQQCAKCGTCFEFIGEEIDVEKGMIITKTKIHKGEL